jgi:hypothetical protein
MKLRGTRNIELGFEKNENNFLWKMIKGSDALLKDINAIARQIFNVKMIHG